MSVDSWLQASPIVLLILLGVLIRASGLIDQKGGLVITRLAYHVTIPAAIFQSVSRTRIGWSTLKLPIVGLVVPIILAAIAYLATRRLAAQPQQRGVMVSGMVVLGVFAYPFCELFFGAQGLANIALFDVGNSIFAGTLALWLAQAFAAREKTGWQSALGHIAKSPVMWAAMLGLVAGRLGVQFQGVAGDFLGRLVAANTPLAMIGVGIFIRPRFDQLRLIVQYVLTRTVLGGILGWLLGLALGLRGLELLVAIIGCSLPAGTSNLVYATNEGLDAELAAAIISVTVIIGIALINILPHILAGALL